MKRENIDKINKIVIVGIGGGAAYYLARYFNLLKYTVIGFDIKKNEKTIELEKEGIIVNYQNPHESLDKDSNLIIYSSALPNEVIENINLQNPSIATVEVGEFYKQLINKFKRNQLNKNETEAFKKANLAPLFEIDYTKSNFIGITGTDGKTSTSYMLFYILKEAGFKPGLVSTTGAKIANLKDTEEKEIDTGFHTTTPSNQELYKIISKMLKEECSHVILEITSHALSMGRTAGIKLDTAIITNITSDHLDYHQNFKEYINAKSIMFTDNLKDTGIAILNFDDKKSYDYLKNKLKNKAIYTKESLNKFFKEKAVLHTTATNIVNLQNKTKFELNFLYNNKKENLNLFIPTVGEYNVSNALAATTTAKTLNIDNKHIQQGLKMYLPPKGRMHILQTEPFKVIVDFAHTSNALEKALIEANILKKKKKNKVIVVFGCAGKRDTTKRSTMGSIAAELADITILTAEDPRTEDLVKINKEIEEGWAAVAKPSKHKKIITKAGSTIKGKRDKTLIRYDDQSLNVHIRRQAIKKALREAHHGDVVIITGKGHENSLCFGTKEYDWNDIEEVKKLLK